MYILKQNGVLCPSKTNSVCALSVWLKASGRAFDCKKTHKLYPTERCMAQFGRN